MNTAYTISSGGLLTTAFKETFFRYVGVGITSRRSDLELCQNVPIQRGSFHAHDEPDDSNGQGNAVDRVDGHFLTFVLSNISRLLHNSEYVREGS